MTPPSKIVERFSFGMGDRFARAGRAQLQAVVRARERGIAVTPVWNKSNREHVLIGTEPISVLEAARAAVGELGWDGGFHVDADHIDLTNVDRFVESSDFFTIDVADYTGKPAATDDIERFVAANRIFLGKLDVPGLDAPLTLDETGLRATAAKFLRAMQEAGRIHRHIAERKGGDGFIAEVSVDETDRPQTPTELFAILAMIAQEGVPAQTIAPKFTGRFNKGVDYVGDLTRFEKEFDEDLCVLAFAVREFGLPDSLKLSVHSGSDKFSLYPIINRLVKKHGAGLHVKTAGTTWLEQIIGLAEAGGGGLAAAREIYRRAHPRFAELVGPYAPVVGIDPARLPAPERVDRWSPEEYVAALRHDRNCAGYNPDFRQFLHVSFKVAAEMGRGFLDALDAHGEVIARNVTDNLLNRHLRPLFG